MKKQLTLLPLLCAAALFLVGCAKKEDEVPENTSTSTTSTSTTSFGWAASGGSTLKADSSYFVQAYNNIVAYKGGNNNVVDIKLSDLKVGTYSLSTLSGNSLEYVTGNSTYSATGGTVSIGANTGTKLSGTFSCALSGGTLTALSGDFTDIPKR
jgi:hypothetical protein